MESYIPKVESSYDESGPETPESLGVLFNTEFFDDFVAIMRRKSKTDPSARFEIVADWVDVNKTRSAKALLDNYGARFRIDSVAIRATRAQYEEDVNAFQSGVKWSEVPENI